MEREEGGVVVDLKVEGNDQLWSVRVVEISGEGREGGCCG